MNPWRSKFKSNKLSQIDVLPFEEKSLLSSSILPLANEPQQSKLEYEEVSHCELDMNEYVCVFNKLMSIGVDGKGCQNLMAPTLF